MSRVKLNDKERQEIVDLFLVDPIEATKLAMNRGLSAAYAYKLTYERGLLPRSRKEWGTLREVLE